MGLICALGQTSTEVWQNIVAGKSGVSKITRFDTTQFACQIAAEVKDFDPLKFIEKKEVKKMGRFIHFAMAAADEAMNMSGLKITPENATRVGVHIGSGVGGFDVIEREHAELLKGGPHKISPFFIPAAIVNLAAGHVSIRYGAKGPNEATATACTTSAHAIGDAFKIIQRGDADCMIAGGTEAAITPMGVGGFAALRALSTRNDDPERASRPFDKDRDGFVVGEGSGVLILEEYERAKARGARIYAELVGYGMSADAYHITAPSEDGDGAFRGMRGGGGGGGGRRRRVPGDAGGDREPRRLARQGRLHQRPRHLDAAGRPARNAGHQALLRRSRRRRGRLLDQVDDRASARRRRRPRGRRHGARRLQPVRAADHQPRSSRR